MNENIKEIGMLELLKKVVRYLWLIVLLIIIFAGFAYYYTDNYIAPYYTASTNVFIGKDSNTLANVNLTDLKIDSQLVIDYQQLIKTNLVAHRVIDELKIYMKPDELIDIIEPVVIDESRFMKIYVTTNSPELSASIANKVSEILVIEAERIVGAKNVQIVDYAEVPKLPVGPSKRMNTMIGGFLGVVIGGTILLILILFNNKVETIEEAEKIMNKPTLGVIPKNQNNNFNSFSVNDAKNFKDESYRAIRTYLDYHNKDKVHQVLMVTSPMPGEGKTDTICNLALSFEKIDKKVLLIDADLRRSSVHKFFDINNGVGLSDVLVYGKSLNDAITKIRGIKNLSILTSGTKRRASNEIASSPLMIEIIEMAREIYDVVLIDSPPILPIADGLVLSKYADGVLVAVAEKSTKVDQLIRTKKALDNVHANILGNIITKAVIKKYKDYNYD